MLDPRVVPPGATDALAALARDELACSLLPPGTHASAARLVAGRLRPDVQHVLAAADEIGRLADASARSRDTSPGVQARTRRGG
jgi:hypothetical protein